MRTKEHDKQIMRNYYNTHKEKLKKDAINYYNKNKEKQKEKMRENYIWNRFARIIKQREYYQDNKEEILIKMSEFAKQNRDVMNEKNKIYAKKHPKKVWARNQARHKIKIPENQICEICKINYATDRDHRDYSKPLEIQFVCHECNCKLERLEIC